MNKELRLYGLVPYNISPIQQGIQYGHSKDEYTLSVLEALMGMKELDKEVISTYYNWLKNWKTYIIMNGGTTNTNPNTPGSLNQHLQTLKDNGIFCTEFYETDLGDQLTGVTFIVNEIVFAKNEDKSYTYTDFVDWYILNVSLEDARQNGFNASFKSLDKFAKFTEKSISGVKQYHNLQIDTKNYNRWVEFMEGEKNVFLRNFLKQFRLA